MKITRQHILTEIDKLKSKKKRSLLDIAKSSNTLKEKSLEAGELVMCGCERTLNGHNHTYFSIMDGVSSPEDMVNKTAMRGFGSIGISDHGTMGGVLRAGKAGKGWYIAKDGAGQSLIVKKVDLKKYLKDYTLCDQSWSALEKEDIDRCLSSLSGDTYVTHHETNNFNIRIVDSSDIKSKEPFKVLSGCELYVSWAKDHGKRYNHITVYATGMKGYRALCLLTSIGSIPSRRYVGGSGFFRPRVFVEDIEVALLEAEGELVVTTGCPISITSEALRAGRIDDARAFFDWGVKHVPKGNFFAELHICDTSLDFNQRYVTAEDKFYSSLYGTPVSRFRFTGQEEALEHATALQRDLNFFLFSAVNGLFGDGPVDHLKNIATTKKAGSSSLASFGQAASPQMPLVESVVALKNFEKYDKSVHERYLNHKEAVFKILNTALIETNAMFAAEEEKKAAQCADDLVLVKVKKKGRKVKKNKTLDEDTFILVSEALRTITEIETALREDASLSQLVNQIAQKSSVISGLSTTTADGETWKRLDRLVATYSLAIFTVYTTSRLIEKENPKFIQAHKIITGIMTSAQKTATTPGSEVIDRALGFGLSENGAPSGLSSILGTYLVRMFSVHKSLPEMYQPTAGQEDDIEKEWVVGQEGNWMETVNRGLVILAKEYDVPLKMATDSHMIDPAMIDVQDAIIRRGKRRNWHMSNPFAIPRSRLEDFLDDIGADWTERNGDYVPHPGNCAYKMLSDGIFTVTDLIEAFGSGALVNQNAKSCGEFEWDIVVPKIRYRNHRYFKEGCEILDSGALRDFLPSPGDKEAKFTFQNKSVNIATALVVATYFNEVEKKRIPLSPEYLDRLHSELYLSQEVGSEQLSDFFLVLQYLITRWRALGVSVGPGRGSSGGMLIAKICGITYGDPLVKGFSQARWMNTGRKAKKAHADIDVDVSDRQVAGLDFARVAKESFEDAILERPLSPLEAIFHRETFFASAPVTHQMVGDQIIEVERKKAKKSILAKDKKAEAEVAEADEPKVKGGKKAAKKDEDEEGVDADDADNLSLEEDEGDEHIVIGAPILRIGTYGSLKAKAAVKDAIRIADETSFEDLPSFGVPTTAWVNQEADRLVGLNEDDINSIFEEEMFGHLPLRERIARRRVKLGDRLTKEMTMGAGMVRLYQGDTSEQDFFAGSVYGIAPSYWEPGMKPSGSTEAADYFKKNPKVESLVLDMLNIFKNQGVHAGGLCFGREVFERVPVRADKHGYVSQFEMKWVEYAGILKFDILGLETLEDISETLKLIIKEEPYEKLSKWIPPDVYQQAVAGESTDLLWPYFPMSTKEAVDVICGKRAMTFQIDTNVFGRELDQLSPSALLALVRERGGDDQAVGNDALVDIASALLALFRPGPMKMNSHTEYIKRMMGEPYTVIHPWLEQFVEKTLGCIAYQEQVMEAYSVGAKAGEEETDEVRRAMGKKDIKALQSIKAEDRFQAGLIEQGVPADIAKQIWEILVPFAEYGFNLSHSWHYAVVTTMTAFLKGHFPKHMFRIKMGKSKPDDLSRFLLEISSETRLPCVLRSVEKNWETIGDFYFPGLHSIEGMSQKNIDRIIAAKDKLFSDGYTLQTITAPLWFCYFGALTESVAIILSKSGLLRIFGSPEEIAAGYEQAYFASFNVEKLNKAQVNADAPQEEMVDAEADDDEVELEDELSGLGTSSSKKKSKNKTKAKTKKSPKKRELNKTAVLVRNILLNLGLKMVTYTIKDDSTSGILGGANKATTVSALDVNSAVEMVKISKTKGGGVRHLIHAINVRENFEAQKDGRKPRIILHLRELKSKERDNGAKLAMGNVYRTSAIVRNLSTTKNFRTGAPEIRVTFIAEGIDLSAKFSKSISASRIEEYSKILKDEKMKTPFIVDLFVDSFTDKMTNRTIVYYKIDNIEKIL